jgi:hypothetical protein
MRRAVASLAGLLLFVAPASRSADLAAHVAHYTLTLQNSTGDVASATGTMTFEMIDACDGWAVRQHLAMVLTNHDGQDIHSVSDYNTYESKDGLSMRFRSHDVTDGEPDDDVEGVATLSANGGPGKVVYTKPGVATKPLPAGTLFPTAHTARIVDEAQQGAKFLSLPLFDGTSDAGGQASSVVMSGWSKTPVQSAFAPLAKLPSGRVHIAFFDGDSDGSQPDYEVMMRYFANGVADDMTMNFGDFVMQAKIDKLTVTKPGC